jgi:hypothetical protein
MPDTSRPEGRLYLVERRTEDYARASRPHRDLPRDDRITVYLAKQAQEPRWYTYVAQGLGWLVLIGVAGVVGWVLWPLVSVGLGWMVGQ